MELVDSKGRVPGVEFHSAGRPEFNVMVALFYSYHVPSEYRIDKLRHIFRTAGKTTEIKRVTLSYPIISY